MNVTKNLAVTPASVVTALSKYASVSSSYPFSNPVGKGSSNTTYAQWNLTTGSNAESYVFYKFNLSEIPADATINSVTCKAKAYINQTNSSRISARTIQLYYQNLTAKGSATTISSSTSVLTLTCGTWTRKELDECHIRLYAKRGTSNTTTTYYCRFYGADLTINYTYDEQTYTVTATLQAPAGCSIDPSTPQELLKGSSYTLSINAAKEEQEVKVTDNGVDVTSKLVRLPDAAFTVQKKEGATYGFQQNYDSNCRDGWWQSTNKGQATSASVSTVTFTVSKVSTVTVSLICYAEATYDYFLLSPLDGSFGYAASADSNAVFTTKNSNSANVQTYIFENVQPGTHTFDVKYYKDSYTDSNWDSAQFTVEVSPSNTGSASYVYQLDNLSADHTIVVIITDSGKATVYRKVNGQWREISFYVKESGQWVKVEDGDRIKQILESVNARY